MIVKFTVIIPEDVKNSSGHKKYRETENFERLSIIENLDGSFDVECNYKTVLHTDDAELCNYLERHINTVVNVNSKYLDLDAVIKNYIEGKEKPKK